jgi:hypothetical protein
MTISAPAHAGKEIVFAEEGLPLFADELCPLIGVDHHLDLWFVPQYLRDWPNVQRGFLCRSRLDQEDRHAICGIRKPCRCPSMPVRSDLSAAHLQAHAGLTVL